MAKFRITETIHSEKVLTVRLGNTGAGNTFTDADVGKAVKLTATDRYDLAAAADAIEGYVVSLNTGLYDGHTIGGIVTKGCKEVVFDGLQATPGTGTIAAGDYVLTGTVTAKNTAGPLKVVKATTQADAKAAPFKARVVSLGTAGTGAVGTTGIIELL